MTLGIVCGLLSEKEALGTADHLIEISGADPQRAYKGALSLADRGVSALVSVGVAGALSRDCQPGDLLLPSEVVNASGKRMQSAAFPDHPTAANTAPIYGSDDLIDSAAAKADLAKRTGCASVDMESHAVAKAAGERGLPFYVIRAIADPADQALPPSAAGAVKPDGSIDTFRTVIGLLRRPQDLPHLIALGKQSAKGHQTLRQVAPGLLARI